MSEINNNKTNKKKFKCAAIIVVVLICVCVVALVLKFCSNDSNRFDVKAQPSSFSLAKSMECNIDNSFVQYSQDKNADQLVINMTVKNVLVPLEYDKNAKTEEDVSDEEAANLTEEEQEELNQNIFNKYKSQRESQFTLSEALSTACQQGKKVLDNTDCATLTDGYQNYEAIKDDKIQSGESVKVEFVYTLKDQQTVNCYYDYQGLIHDDQGNVIDSQNPEIDEYLAQNSPSATVEFDNENKATESLKSTLKGQDSGVLGAKTAEEKTLQGFKYKLVDNWRVTKDGQMAVKLQSTDFSKGSVEITVSSSQTAEQQATSDVSMFSTSAQPQKTNVGGIDCYKLLPNENC